LIDKETGDFGPIRNRSEGGGVEEESETDFLVFAFRLD